MQSRTLYLVRHGALIVDERGRFLGQLDVPLSERGIAQAYALRDRCRQVPITAIFCSDLCRCRETAEILASDTAIETFPRWDLREVSLGLWDGCTLADIARRHPREFKARGEDIVNFRPPGGESFADCRMRVLAAVDEILASSSGEILIVAHAGVNRLILCEALGIPISNLFRIGQEYGCLNVLEQTSSGYRVKLVNFTPQNALLESERFVFNAEPVPVG